MSSPTFVHRFRPITNLELGRLITHLANSGTTYAALARFSEQVAHRVGWHRGSWTIPLPGDSNLYYVIGEPPAGFERLPVQQEIQWSEEQPRR